MISNIEEIKAAADIVEVIGDYVKLKKHGANMQGLCPFHSEKTPSFTVSKAKHLYKCFGCGRSGDVVAFLMEHDNLNYVEAIKAIASKYNLSVEEKETKSYDKPPPRLEKVSPELIKWFESRGISNNTLLRLKITESVEWMPQAKAETRVVCFNYYRSDELINIKYRAKDKDFRLHKNAELIFYNLDAIQDETTAVIVEGEIDCLSLHEAGIYNAVSVPNGAGVGNMQLQYLDNCWQYFENKDRIILLTDNDAPGIALRDELARRLGKDRCYKVTFPADCKDANDVLIKHGKGMIQSMIDQAIQWPIDGVITMDMMFDKVQDYYENGYPKGYAAGIGEFDEYLHFSGGQFTTVTGSPGSGKSEFIDYISTHLARNHGWKFAVCSFENPADIHVTKLMEKFMGLSFNFRKDPYHRMSRSHFEQGVSLVDKYFQFINIQQAEVTIQGILSKLRELVLRTGIKGAIIDPWNYIEHKVPNGYTETQYISEALTLIKEFVVKNDIHLFLVAHPKKLMKDPKTKQYPVATMYDISGSAHFFNKTDNGISIHRDFSNNSVTVYVQKVRFSWLGKLGYSIYGFDTFTRQYLKS
jgi:twinkle protein